MTDARDRRRHVRYPIDLQGLLSAPGEGMRRCVVRDYCLGGLLIEASDGVALGDPGQRVRVDVELSLPTGPRPLPMTARVVWSRETYQGLAFEGESPEWVRLLERHQVYSAGPQANANEEPGGAARVRARLRHRAKALLPGILRDLLINANERLLAVADQFTSNSQQAQLFADMNALDRLRKSDKLVNAVLAACDGASVEGEREADAGLSLVDRDEFERWLEASRSATLLERRLGETLTKLASRLAAIQGSDGLQGLHAPFEPQHFTDALKQIAGEIGVAAETRRELFDAATQVLSDRLPGFYEELSAMLDGLGVPQASDRAYRVIKTPSAAAPVPAQGANPETVPESMPIPVGPSTDGTGLALGSAAALGPAATLSLDQGVLETARATLHAQRVAQADELLAEVLELPSITDSLQGWLGQLDAPLKAQAKADPGLFQDAGNSLRAIIDALGHLQLFRPSPDGPIETDELRRQVDALLAPLADGDASGAALDFAADRIGRLTQSESRRYQLNVERVVEASEGRERVRRARALVVSTLNERYASREVPEVLLDLIETGWRSVLELAQLRDDAAEEAFEQRLLLIDVLVAKLGGQAFAAAGDLLTDDALFAAIGKELASAAFDPFRVTAVEKRLRRELLEAQGEPARLVRFAPLPEDEDPANTIDPPAAIAPNAWAAILEQCESVRVGDRLRFSRVEHGQPSELRVAWVREDRALYTLVDHRGLRKREINRPDLALGLYRREIQLERIDGEPLSERAADTLLARMEQRLSHQASHDSLTGLINRNQFKAALEQQLRRTGGGSGAMLWLDIDQFRLINDMHGYDAGDRLLVAVARLLEQAQGAQVLAHIGADRFAMLLPDVAAEQAAGRAEALREKVADMPFSLATQSLSVSVSIGLVALDALDALGAGSVSGLMQAADDALSAAKGEGGNRIFVYDEQDPVIQRHRASVHWVAQVDDSLERGQLNLRCQAIVPVLPDRGLAPHYEVLLGVANSAQELLPIAEFIDAAERYNRMRAVDRWITRTVMEWIAAHRTEMPRLHGFAVNLSGQTASDPAFVDYVRQAFQRTGIDPSWLSFEVTETAAVADLSTSAGIVQDLKALGCRVALDDFGSGLASYSYLKELPVDWLKIDGAFVRKIAADSGDYAVVKSINDIGHFLGKQTIAEYVADQHILRLVAEIGVDYAQGYAIAEPVLMSDLIVPAEAKRA